MQQKKKTTALQHELRQTTGDAFDRTLVFLSVLAAASFRIAITLSLS